MVQDPVARGGAVRATVESASSRTAHALCSSSLWWRKGLGHPLRSAAGRRTGLGNVGGGAEGRVCRSYALGLLSRCGTGRQPSNSPPSPPCSADRRSASALGAGQKLSEVRTPRNGAAAWAEGSEGAQTEHSLRSRRGQPLVVPVGSRGHGKRWWSSRGFFSGTQGCDAHRDHPIDQARQLAPQ